MKLLRLGAGDIAQGPARKASRIFTSTQYRPSVRRKNGNRTVTNLVREYFPIVTDQSSAAFALPTTTPGTQGRGAGVGRGRGVILGRGVGPC